MKPEYLKNKDIDKKKWDDCIKNAPNERIYAYSWYLDSVAENWDAWVWGDYEAVMPLPWKSKLGIKYVYMPPFCQQLGVFGKSSFLNKATFNSKFISICYSYSSQNQDFKQIESFKIKLRKNYSLLLNKSYEEIHSLFSKNHKKNIAKHAKSQINVIEVSGLDCISIAIQMYKEEYVNKYKKLKEIDLYKLSELLKILHRQSNLLIYFVKKGDSIIASGCFPIYKNKIYYLLGAPNQEGRNFNAIYKMLNTVISTYSNSGFLLDFEGSEIPNVEYFYKGFGAQVEPYYHVQYYQLFGLKW